jgi:hypothetical protein
MALFLKGVVTNSFKNFGLHEKIDFGYIFPTTLDAICFLGKSNSQHSRMAEEHLYMSADENSEPEDEKYKSEYKIARIMKLNENKEDENYLTMFV